MNKNWKKFLLAAGFFCAVSIALPYAGTHKALAAGAGGHGGSGGGHSGGGSHSDGGGDSHTDHEDGGEHGGGKGPQYRGGRGGVSHGHTSDGHSVEDHIFHGKHGKRWSDEWPGASDHENGEDHTHDSPGDTGHD